MCSVSRTLKRGWHGYFCSYVAKTVGLTDAFGQSIESLVSQRTVCTLIDGLYFKIRGPMSLDTLSSPVHYEPSMN